MQRERAASLLGRAELLALVVAAVAIWWGLDLSESRAGWLRVEAPRHALADQRLPMRVHLAPLAEPAYLSADLHWGISRDTPKGYLATGGAKAVGNVGGAFDFEIMVPRREGLRYVTGIIYLSRTGSWDDHTLVAATEVIPVRSSTVDKVEARLESLRVKPLGGSLSGHPRPTALPRLLTALLFLAGAVLAWGGGRSPLGLSAAPVQANQWWRALAAALAVACVWELLGLEAWLGEQVRVMARAGDLYYPRAQLQKIVISVAIAATAACLMYVRRVPGPWRLLLVSLALYVGILVVNLASLHTIDTIADLSWQGLSVMQALKLGCAALTLRGVLSAGHAR
jgi:hypothetical protein